MGMFANLAKAVIQKRTRYRAIYGGKTITGCGECGNNKEFPGLLPFAPTHKCIVTCTTDEDLLTILDPYNIPEDCPIKVILVEE